MPNIEPNPAAQLPTDRRPASTHPVREPRKKTYLFGLLVHSNGAFTADCVVRNISVGGAKITLAKRQLLPGDIHLIVVKYGLACRADVVWLDFPARGLRFADRHFLAESLQRELMFLRQLWLGLCPRSGGIPVVEPWDADQRMALSGLAF